MNTQPLAVTEEVLARLTEKVIDPSSMVFGIVVLVLSAIVFMQTILLINKWRKTR